MKRNKISNTTTCLYNKLLCISYVEYMALIQQKKIVESDGKKIE